MKADRRICKKKQPFEELAPIDLQKCNTVAEIVYAMRQCSFGARMLGEATETFYKWTLDNEPPVAIYDGKPNTPLAALLNRMVGCKMLKMVVTSENYSCASSSSDKLVIVGGYPERVSCQLYNHPAIFINQFGLANPKQVKDGHFSNVVFADPQFVLPVIFYSLKERREYAITSVSDLLENDLSGFDGLAADVVQGAKILKAMIDDKDCSVFLTISGAMTIAQMSLIFCDMIDKGWIKGISATGALMAHGLIQSLGLKHYKHNPEVDDHALAKRSLNRVTDTLEPETNFDHLDEAIDSILKNFGRKPKPISPTLFHLMIGKYLAEKYPDERGILKSAYQKKVPVFVPAFVDSEIGNDFYVHNLIRQKSGKKPLVMNLERDTEILVDMAVRSKRMGIFTIGGGVPRNNIQNVAPLLEIIRNRTSDKKIPLKQFSYGCRIAPDPMWLGHLSGCTYNEGKSWKKMDIHGKFAEVHCDATIILPFIVKYVMEQMEK
ncbi:MAG: deoxyhypusine synthase family protein [Patescibacteria group bacterium]